MISSLSASGSISLPNCVTSERRRASQPSSASVAEAITNTIAASRSDSASVERSSAASTGMSEMRTSVRTFAALSGSIRRCGGSRAP